MGQTLGGALRGETCSWIWLQCKGGPTFWRRERENWNTFSKPAETGIYKEVMGQGGAGGLTREGIEEGRGLAQPIPSSPSSQDSSQLWKDCLGRPEGGARATEFTAKSPEECWPMFSLPAGSCSGQSVSRLPPS